MNEALFQRLIQLEPEIRPMMGDYPNSSITISFDANGTTYSVVVNDGIGGSNSVQKRVPVKKLV